MKHLSYNEMTELLDSKMDLIKSKGFEEIVGVVRGGLTPAQYVATQLRSKMGVFFPKTRAYEKPRLVLTNPQSKKILFVEDLVSMGRTFTELSEYMERYHSDMEWDFLPVFTDSGFPVTFELCPLVASEWIAMPWEKPEHIRVGGKGLFRLDEDGYKKGSAK